jgi:hypothetical protein
MHTLFRVLNTDAVNRYNEAFTPGALAGALEQRWKAGTPILVGHDASRPLGWTAPQALHFAPGHTRLYGMLQIVENRDDAEIVSHQLNAYLASEGRAHADEFGALRAALAPYLRGDELQLRVECTSLIGLGLARRAVADAFVKVNRDGLRRIRDLVPIAPGVYRFGDLALFAHCSFRRAHHPLNRLNARFLAYLASLDGDRITAQIALDPDMVGLASSYLEYHEREYWWGPGSTTTSARSRRA